MHWTRARPRAESPRCHMGMHPPLGSFGLSAGGLDILRGWIRRASGFDRCVSATLSCLCESQVVGSDGFSSKVLALARPLFAGQAHPAKHVRDDIDITLLRVEPRFDTCGQARARRVRASRVFRITRNSKTSPSARRAYSDDSSQQGAKTQTVRTVTSKHELDELVKTASKEAKITVLEVAKLGSIGKEGKPRKSTAQVSTNFLRVATDFKDKAVFAALYIDHSEATKCAAESLKVREVPCVFVWDDQGELASNLTRFPSTPCTTR